MLAAYFRAAARPSLLDLTGWLFNSPELQAIAKPTHRRTSPSTMGLSFGVVREPGMMGPTWVVSPPTTDAATADLLHALHGIARAQRPDFPYIWAHISTSFKHRRVFCYSRDAIAISLSNGQCYDLAGGKQVPAELREPGTLVSFNCPTAIGELPEDTMAVLGSAGFVSASG